MTKREIFINLIQTEIFDKADIWAENYGEDYNIATTFWEEFKNSKVTVNNKITENGKKILLFMQENEEAMNNIFTSKEIAEAFFTSGRSIAGSMRKLVSDEFVSKEGKDPIRYSLTEAGRSLSLKT